MVRLADATIRRRVDSLKCHVRNHDALYDHLVASSGACLSSRRLVVVYKSIIFEMRDKFAGNPRCLLSVC